MRSRATVPWVEPRIGHPGRPAGDPTTMLESAPVLMYPAIVSLHPEGPMNACELWGYPIGDGNAGEAAGMKLCAPCYGGRFGDRLAHRGLRLQCLVKQPHIVGSSHARGRRRDRLRSRTARVVFTRGLAGQSGQALSPGTTDRPSGLRIPTDQLDALRQTNPRLSIRTDGNERVAHQVPGGTDGCCPRRSRTTGRAIETR